MFILFYYNKLGEAKQKSRAQKITEARRVGAPRNIASPAWRGELTT